MITFNQKIALVTGGAAGIGKIMARLLLEQNATVVLWDINQENLDKTVVEFSKLGKVVGYKVDVSNTDQIAGTAKKVKEEIGKVDVLINNAGIVVGKYFHEHSLSDIQRTMAINANAPMWITQAFLPDMMASNSGHICNIASSAGLVANPKMTVYAASKWSLVGWSDSLRIELQQLKKNIGVTTIMPFYINTGMFDGVKSPIIPIQDPEKASKRIINAIKKNKKLVTLPRYVYNMTRLAQGFLPAKWLDGVMGKVFGIYTSMQDFVGHKK